MSWCESVEESGAEASLVVLSYCALPVSGGCYVTSDVRSADCVRCGALHVCEG